MIITLDLNEAQIKFLTACLAEIDETYYDDLEEGETLTLFEDKITDEDWKNLQQKVYDEEKRYFPEEYTTKIP